MLSPFIMLPISIQKTKATRKHVKNIRISHEMSEEWSIIEFVGAQYITDFGEEEMLGDQKRMVGSICDTQNSV